MAKCNQLTHLPSKGLKVWFRLWGAVRIQTRRLSAVFRVVYTERTHVDCWRIGSKHISRVHLCSLIDNDIISLIGLVLIADKSSREHARHVWISRLTLSLYLISNGGVRHGLGGLAPKCRLAPQWNISGGVLCEGFKFWSFFAVKICQQYLRTASSPDSLYWNFVPGPHCAQTPGL